MVTSHDVAREAGVSQSTVSRVLRGNDRVDAVARDRVLAALEALQYVPNASAKAMRTARAGAIGIVAAEILNPYFPQLLDMITREAKSRDLSVILWNDDDPKAPMAQAAVASGSVDGVMFVAAREQTPALDILRRRGVPTLLLSRAPAKSDFDSVTSDHEGSGYTSADYFLRHGRFEMAAIFGPRDTFASPAREKGFRRRLDESGIDVPDHRWKIGETSYEHGWDSVMGLVQSGYVPPALFCSADVIAFGAMAALRENGYRVPEDVWVMGNDGLPMSAWNGFDLTTNQQPVEDIVRAGMGRLVERIGGDRGPAQNLMLPTELVVRGSTNWA